MPQESEAIRILSSPLERSHGSLGRLAIRVPIIEFLGRFPGMGHGGHSAPGVTPAPIASFGLQEIFKSALPCIGHAQHRFCDFTHLLRDN